MPPALRRSKNCSCCDRCTVKDEEEVPAAVVVEFVVDVSPCEAAALLLCLRPLRVCCGGGRDCCCTGGGGGGGGAGAALDVVVK